MPEASYVFVPGAEQGPHPTEVRDARRLRRTPRMPRSNTRKLRSTWPAGPVVLLVVGGSLPALAGASVAKTFTMTITPASLTAGASSRSPRRSRTRRTSGSGPPTCPCRRRSRSPGRRLARHDDGRRQQGQAPHRGLAPRRVHDVTANAVAAVRADHGRLPRERDDGVQLHRYHAPLTPRRRTRPPRSPAPAARFVAGRQPGSAHPDDQLRRPRSTRAETRSRWRS